MHIIKPFLLIFYIFSAAPVAATVGGPQYLKFLGENDSSLYFLYEYHDESANPPELWRYDLKNRALDINNEWINYPSETLEAALERHKLEQFIFPDTISSGEDLHFTFNKSVTSYMPGQNIFYDKYPVDIIWEKDSFRIFQCFDKEPHPEVKRHHKFSELRIAMAIIRYKGICMETGYEKDTLLIRSLTAAEIEEGVISEDNEHLILVTALTLLSIILMSYIFFRRRNTGNKKKRG